MEFVPSQEGACQALQQWVGPGQAGYDHQSGQVGPFGRNESPTECVPAIPNFAFATLRIIICPEAPVLRLLSLRRGCGNSSVVKSALTHCAKEGATWLAVTKGTANQEICPTTRACSRFFHAASVS